MAKPKTIMLKKKRAAAAKKLTQLPQGHGVLVVRVDLDTGKKAGVIYVKIKRVDSFISAGENQPGVVVDEGADI